MLFFSAGRAVFDMDLAKEFGKEKDSRLGCVLPRPANSKKMMTVH
jgi:hypothetical protein